MNEQAPNRSEEIIQEAAISLKRNLTELAATVTFPLIKVAIGDPSNVDHSPLIVLDVVEGRAIVITPDSLSKARLWDSSEGPLMVDASHLEELPASGYVEYSSKAEQILRGLPAKESQ